MTYGKCERCGYAVEAAAFERNGCPRCAERAVRQQMRRFASIQARHVRELRSRAEGPKG